MIQKLISLNLTAKLAWIQSTRDLNDDDCESGGSTDWPWYLTAQSATVSSSPVITNHNHPIEMSEWKIFALIAGSSQYHWRTKIQP